MCVFRSATKLAFQFKFFGEEKNTENILLLINSAIAFFCWVRSEIERAQARVIPELNKPQRVAAIS